MVMDGFPLLEMRGVSRVKRGQEATRTELNAAGEITSAPPIWLQRVAAAPLLLPLVCVDHHPRDPRIHQPQRPLDFLCQSQSNPLVDQR
jgi:hypothetical protein